MYYISANVVKIFVCTKENVLFCVPMSTIYPFSRPLYALAKPVGARCNMRCTYCYYLEKDEADMSDELLEIFVRNYIESQTSAEVCFTWHGGEPMLRGLDFYRRLVADSPALLKDDGFLAVEVGIHQAQAVAKMAAQSGSFVRTEIIKDYGGIERVVVAWKK